MRETYEDSTFDPKYDMIEKLDEVECIWTKYCKIGGKVYETLLHNLKLLGRESTSTIQNR